MLLNCLPVHITGEHELVVGRVEVEGAVLCQSVEDGDVLEGDHVSHVPAVSCFGDVGLPQLLEALLLAWLYLHHLHVDHVARIARHQV